MSLCAVLRIRLGNKEMRHRMLYRCVYKMAWRLSTEQQAGRQAGKGPEQLATTGRVFVKEWSPMKLL